MFYETRPTSTETRESLNILANSNWEMIEGINFVSSYLIRNPWKEWIGATIIFIKVSSDVYRISGEEITLSTDSDFYVPYLDVQLDPDKKLDDPAFESLDVSALYTFFRGRKEISLVKIFQYPRYPYAGEKEWFIDGGILIEKDGVRLLIWANMSISLSWTLCDALIDRVLTGIYVLDRIDPR
jgi:hypothetical protein